MYTLLGCFVRDLRVTPHSGEHVSYLYLFVATMGVVGRAATERAIRGSCISLNFGRRTISFAAARVRSDLKLIVDDLFLDRLCWTVSFIKISVFWWRGILHGAKKEGTNTDKHVEQWSHYGNMKLVKLYNVH